jgi:hypothetical protein
MTLLQCFGKTRPVRTRRALGASARHGMALLSWARPLVMAAGY